MHTSSRRPGRRELRRSRFFIAVIGSLGVLASAAPAAALEAPPSAARAQDIAERRTPNSQTWPAKGGGFVTQVSPGDPIFWRDNQKQWRPYDLNLRRSGEKGLAANVGAGAITLPSAETGTLSLRNGDQALELVLRGGAKHDAPVPTGRTVTYRDVLPGVTRTLSTIPSGIKEDLVIASSSAPRSFDYSLRVSPGLTPTVNALGELIVRAGSSTAFAMRRGVAYEQTNRFAAYPVQKYRLERESDSTWRLTVALDEQWANAPNRKWPVVLDPQIDTEQGVAEPSRECQIEGASTNARAGEITYCPPYPELQSGQYLDTQQTPRVDETTMRFSLPGGGSTGSIVTKATLTVHPTTTLGAGPFAFRASRLTERLPTASTTLHNPHAVVADDVKVVTAGTPATFDVTNMVSGWKEARYPNYGLALTASPGQLDGSSQSVLNQYRAYIATSSNPDPAKRPVLTIQTAPLAQAVSEISSPTEGHLTSRYVELVAKAGSSNVKSTTFEYLAGATNAWRTVPASALRFKYNGQQPDSSLIPIDEGQQRNKILIWDLTRTPGTEVDGQVQVRAAMEDENTTGGGYSTVRAFRVDRKNPKTSSAHTAGPGSVDLLTGDLSITETDADQPAFLQNLSLTRTYHSRGVSPRVADMFGPGWIPGFDAEGGEMPYRSIYNYTEIEEVQELAGWNISSTKAFWDSAYWDEAQQDIDFNYNLLNLEFIFQPKKYDVHYATVELKDGSKATFRKAQNANVWNPHDHNLNIRLEPALSGKLSVVDASGRTLFTPVSEGSPNYQASSFTKKGASAGVTYEYEAHNGRSRLKRIMAATPYSGGCAPGGYPDPGCRGLQFDWNDGISTDTGTVSRVANVKMLAYQAGGSVLANTRIIKTYSYDGKGRVASASDPRTANGLPTTYAYDAKGRMTTYTPPGERPWSFEYRPGVGDDTIGPLKSIKRQTPEGADANMTFVYDVPVAGSGSPRDLSHTALASWGQSDAPLTATAVFPADAVPSGSGMPSSWDRATIYYIGGHGFTTNIADAEGNIETKEYDDYGNVVRELTARNRERALAATGSTAARALELDTTHDFHANHVDPWRTLGPIQEFRRPDGSTVVGQQRTVRGYDEGKPTAQEFAEDQHLITSQSIGIRRLSDGQVLDEETTTYAYSSGSSNRGWQVGKPLSVTVGTGSETSTTQYTYHATLPLLIEKRLPKSSGSTSQVAKFEYYGINGAPVCVRLPIDPFYYTYQAYAGLLCRVLRIDSGATIKRLHHEFSYDFWWNQLKDVETVARPQGSGQSSPLARVTSRTFDVLNRETSRTVSGAVGNPIPAVQTTYSAETGRVMSTTSSLSGVNQTITRTWDNNGRAATYTDALGTTTTHTYDINGRPSSVTEKNGGTTYGTRGFVYDNRDQVSSIVDSSLSGPIQATRDADGQLLTQTLPGGVRMTRAYDNMGVPTSQEWERTTGCSGSACKLSGSAVDRNAQGRVAQLRSDDSTADFLYDSQGRLTREDNVRAGVCVRNEYSFDKNSNRTSRSSVTSGGGGSCGSGTTSTANSTYDVNDRITNSGYSYDTLGRTLTVPAADSPAGAGATTLTYDQDNRVASISNTDVKQTIQRDPLRRMWFIFTTGGSSSAFGALRYGSDEDSPTGKLGTTWWERYVTDVEGGQIATATDLGTVNWQLTDIQGNVVASLPDGASAPSGRTDYWAFGARTWASGTWTPSGHTGTTHAFLGYYGKQTAGGSGSFVHMGERVYNPVTGRFLQPDPVEDGSANDYDYCNQDPINCLDLDGRKVFDLVVDWKNKRLGLQLGRKWTLYLTKTFVSFGIGAAAAQACKFLKLTPAVSWFGCGILSTVMSDLFTPVNVKWLLREKCLEFGIQQSGGFLSFSKPETYSALIRCSAV